MDAASIEVPIREWLASIGVVPSEAVKACLEEEKVDVEAIQTLNGGQLKELGFKMGEQGKILKASSRSEDHTEQIVMALTALTQRVNEMAKEGGELRDEVARTGSNLMRVATANLALAQAQRAALQRGAVPNASSRLWQWLVSPFRLEPQLSPSLIQPLLRSEQPRERSAA